MIPIVYTRLLTLIRRLEKVENYAILNYYNKITEITQPL